MPRAIDIALSDTTHEAWRQKAASAGVSLSQLARDAVAAYVPPPGREPPAVRAAPLSPADHARLISYVEGNPCAAARDIAEAFDPNASEAHARTLARHVTAIRRRMRRSG